MSRTSKAFCAFVVNVPFLLVLCGAQIHHSEKFQPPEGKLTVGLRETERHRAPLSPLPIGRSRGSPENVTFWVHVDDEGRVLEAREFKADAPFPFDFRTDALVEAVRKITYRPFFRNGVATEAWVQDEVEVGTEPEPPPVSAPGATFPKLVEATGFSIQLSRSGCYGTCPSYSVVIYGDGTIDFHGRRYVAIPGDFQAHIAPEAAARLLERFRAADFFDLKDKYVAGVTDNPTYCLELVIGAKKKTITDYVGTWVGMPALINELEDAVDETAGKDRVVSAGPQTVAAMREAGIELNSKQAGEILVYAVKEGKSEAVRSLLVAGAPVRTQDANHVGMSLLAVATFIRDREGQREVFEALLENAEVRADKSGLQEALGSVAGDGNVEVARALIAAGADPTQLFHDTYDIFPLADRLLAAGASKAELTRTLADACDSRQWRDGLINRGANSSVCSNRRQLDDTGSCGNRREQFPAVSRSPPARGSVDVKSR